MFVSATLLLLATYAYRDSLFTQALSSSVPSTSPGCIIDTGYAKYLGNRSYPNTVAYLGIPYAEPPVGNRRFRAPLPLNKTRLSLEAKGAVVDASEYSDFCVQGTTGGGDAGGAGSEDCLKVNIYAPTGANKESNHPVLVYFHGGGYIYGNPRNWPFDHWINQSPNVVIVSVYYRLSSFGFLATPEFGDRGNGDFNAGFLDQIQALKWVKENIGNFGGDPKKVTINGESAGGSSVELHLVANEGERLFNQAIAQSVFRGALPTPEQQKPLFDFYANRAGCGAGTVATQLVCLRKASVSALARAQDAAATSAFTASGYNTFHPVLDGKVITDFPTHLILAGKFARVPLIVGATTNESLRSSGDDIFAALKPLFPLISESDVSALLEAYPLSDFAGLPDLRFQTLIGEVLLRCARSIMGTAFGSVKKSWTYRYNQRVPGTAAVEHAAENWMMFKGTSTGVNGTTTFSEMSPTDTAFAEELIAYWISFVRSGDPNKFKLKRSPVWTPFTSNKSRIVLQEGPADSTTVSGSFLEQESGVETGRCKLVASQAGVQQN